MKPSALLFVLFAGLVGWIGIIYLIMPHKTSHLNVPGLTRTMCKYPDRPIYLLKNIETGEMATSTGRNPFHQFAEIEGITCE